MVGLCDSKDDNGVAVPALPVRLSGAPCSPQQPFWENPGYCLCKCVCEREEIENQTK